MCTGFGKKKALTVCKSDLEKSEVVNKDEISAGSYRVIQNTVELNPGFK